MGRQRSLGRPEVVLTGTAPDDEARRSARPMTVRAAQIAATSYSAQDALRAKDFAEFTDDELREARRIVAAMRWDLGRRRTWRRRRNEGREPDLRPRRAREHPLRRRAAARADPRTHVEAAAARDHRRRQRIDGALRADAAALHLQRRRAANGASRRSSSPRASRASPARSRGTASRDAPMVARHVPDWGGGTRIGDAVRTFNVHWARRVVLARRDRAA